MTEFEDPEAPHGRDPDGVPLAPYGHRADGRPKLSNRGRAPKAPPKKAEKNTRASASSARSRSKRETKEQLMSLVQLVTAPIGSASQSPAVRRRLGPKADALAGSAVIIEAYADPFLDATIQAAQAKPGLLAWMDQMEDKAPYLAMLQVGVQMGKALVQNWVSPDPRLAKAGRMMGPVRAAQMAAAIEREAAELGLDEESILAEMREQQTEEAQAA